MALKMHTENDDSRLQEDCGLLVRFIRGVGTATSFFCGALVIVIIVQVVARYVFGRGFVMLEELEWHLYGAGFLMGLSYCAVNDTNVRMDLLYSRYTLKKKAWMEIISVLSLFMPFVIIMFVESLDFVQHSWRLSEHSQAPLGLPCRWLIKAFIPAGFLLLALAGMTRLAWAFKVIKAGGLKKGVTDGGK